ncbi:MAG: UbiH/UbiF/VisC/COQ6 family ubiquinone biosynthesis hydroxylase [Pseudohongiella sp.]|nr:UbiH/UbiF/VisC/COQ6 family ubiquinone biosynthesis hydroxylase [Pseudohongiella sp.]
MSAATTKTDYDVVIVGAGPIGAAMALALRKSGLRLALLDSQPLQDSMSLINGAEFDPRVSAITPASEALFESLGVWSAMQNSRVSPYTDMHVCEADGTADINFCAADIHAPVLGHIVENRVMVAAMHQALRSQPLLDCLMPASVIALDNAPQAAVLTLDTGRQLSARLVIAADGAQSPLRQLAGFQTREWDYEHEAIVCSVRTDKPHQQCARQVFMDQGVLAFLPLAAPDNEAEHWCSIVWSVIPATAQSLLAMPDPDFCRALSYASEHWLGDVTHSSKRFSFSLRQRHALEYVNKRVVLIGDAAHSIHPLAGQGANLGLADVQALADVLARVDATGRDPADPVLLARYQRDRKPHNMSMMLLMEGFKRLYAEQPLPIRWLRNTGMRAVEQTPWLKNQLIRAAMGTHA